MKRRLALIAALLLIACEKKAVFSGVPRLDAVAPAAQAGPDATPALAPAEPHLYTKEILAPIYHIDRIYKSMTGPQSTRDFYLASADDPELLWIVGFEAVMVEPDGKTPASQQWMCHSNLDLDPTEHNKSFGGEKRLSGRLFTLSQGQYRIDLPKGFGIPILSSELLSLNTQVLNLNMVEGKKDVRHRIFVRFVRDAELKADYKPLFPAAAYGLKLLSGKDGVYGGDSGQTSSMSRGMAAMGEMHHGASCLPGQTASSNTYDDGRGRNFTGHWIVKPGREVNHTRVTAIMDLPFDTTLHYVAVHLHPFAESLELTDTTAGKTIYKALTQQVDRGIGLARVDFFASEQGIPLSRGHEYELTSVYDNPTGKDQDSMAVMNLYLLDKEFVKPDLAKAKLEQQAKRAAGQKKAERESSAPKGM